jgi:hypothetical protein
MKLSLKGLLLLGSLVISTLLSAALLIPLSIEELSQSADVIVHGTVLSKTCLRDPDGRIYTRVELQLHEVWKGSVSSNTFTLVHSGGILGEERVVSSAQVEYDVGEEVAAFLRLNQRGEGVTLGLVQGKFHVSTDRTTGEKLAHNVFHGSPDAGAAGATPARRAVASQATPASLRLAELKERAQKAVR